MNLQGVKSWFCRTFTINSELRPIMESLIALECSVNDIRCKIDEEIEIMTKDLETSKTILETIGDTAPDMIWMKNLNGKYIYANDAIKEGLLFDNNPLGKTDIQMAKSAKIRFGEYNHTFGEKCADSDKIVRKLAEEGTFVKEDGRFLESGMIKGKMVYLEVFKAPVYVDGELIGICGVGRDMTEYVEAYRKHECHGCNLMQDIFKKYEFGE